MWWINIKFRFVNWICIKIFFYFCFNLDGKKYWNDFLWLELELITTKKKRIFRTLKILIWILKVLLSYNHWTVIILKINYILKKKEIFLASELDSCVLKVQLIGLDSEAKALPIRYKFLTKDSHIISLFFRELVDNSKVITFYYSICEVI